MLRIRPASPTALLWCMFAFVAGAAARLAVLSDLTAIVDKTAYDERETILARDPELPPDSQLVTQPSATQGVLALPQLLVFSQPCRTVPLLVPFKNHAERKHHRRVKRLKEVNTSLNSTKQAQFPNNEPSSSVGSSSLWLHLSQNRSLISGKKLTNSHLLSMRPKKGQNRTWRQHATGRIVPLRPGWFINPRDPNSLRSVSRHPFTSFLEKRVAANDFSQTSLHGQNFKSVNNQQSTPPQGSAKKQRKQVYATGRNQLSTETSIIQRLLNLIHTYGKNDELMESSIPRVGSTETFLQPSPSNFDIYSEAHTQTQEQKPFEIPGNLFNVLDLYYEANLHDNEHRDEPVSDALPPAPPSEFPSYPISQPFIPAYHQVSPPSPPNVVQDSLTPASHTPSLSSISLISSVVSDPTNCFEDTLCTMVVAFALALSASTLILLPFSQGRRRRSLDDRTHNSEDMMKPLVSGLLQGLELEQCLFLPIFSRPSIEDDPQRASHMKTEKVPIMCITRKDKAMRKIR
ncbi:hypothetical protein E2C01_023219 [Portunus trituberculatus]|uniref:Uncharacterized protein n=1 Tax=Portunus trituberculatus TaxID=210409 RepID=A0A5B7E9F5_PORTR|nr:hypothetical protein [Portunus trituberculatus]